MARKHIGYSKFGDDNFPFKISRILINISLLGVQGVKAPGISELEV